jgi:hypothetical protein
MKNYYFFIRFFFFFTSCGFLRVSYLRERALILLKGVMERVLGRTTIGAAVSIAGGGKRIEVSKENI